MTTFFLLSMGECVLEAESGSMRGEFLCATAADIFFSMTKSGMEEGQPLGYVTRKYTENIITVNINYYYYYYELSLFFIVHYYFIIIFIIIFGLDGKPSGEEWDCSNFGVLVQ